MRKRTGKTWTVRFRQIDKSRFEEVRSGRKKFETRAATVKYAPMQEGDAIRFVCGRTSFTKQIGRKYHFKTVEAMFKKLPLKKIMPDITLIADAKKRYGSYPNYEEKIKTHGIFAFELA